MAPACPNCGFSGPSSQECLKCGVVFAKFQKLESPPEPPSYRSVSSTKKKKRKFYDFEPDDLRINAMAVPAAFLFIPLAKLLWFPALIFDACGIWLHEFGHALIAWFDSRAATPLGIGWTNVGAHPSWIVYICFLFLLVVSAWKGWKEKAYFMSVVAGIFFILQTYFTFLAHDDRYRIAMTYAGIGGEMYLGALMVIAFNYRFPPEIRWDFTRWLVLLVGAYSLGGTFYQWVEISQNRASIPWGTLLHGEGDAGGDMNQLMNIWGWRKPEIIAIYIKTGIFSLAAVLVNYGIFLFRALSRRDNP